MSLRLCFRCGIPLRTGEDVALTVFAKYHELRSKVAWSIERPYDADEDTLRHRSCPITRND